MVRVKSKLKWNVDKISKDLIKIKYDIGRFPTGTDLITLDRQDLVGAVCRYGGFIKFRKILNEELIQVPKGYWIDETIIEEIVKIKNIFGCFPSENKLIESGRSDLVHAIARNGGFNRFRSLIDDELLRVPNGYWTENNIIEEITKIKNKINHFPSYQEISDLNRYDLNFAIGKNGGFQKFREIMNCENTRMHKGYWTDETIKKELIKIKSEIGHFPTMNNLNSLYRSDLSNQISIHGGVNKFRELLGDEILKVSDGYWTDDTILQNLIEIKSKIGHFPSQIELNTLGRQDLSQTMWMHGGSIKFKLLMGETPSLLQQYISELMSYVNKRGKSSEKLIKNILQDYCKQNGYMEPNYNKRLSKGNIIEFVCNTNKTVGIDVTNTISNDCIINKWRKRGYYLYLDELWIVVFSDSFTQSDYLRWNQESPDNVKVMSIYQFLEELDYSISDSIKNKIDKYCACTFHTKEELKKIIGG